MKRIVFTAILWLVPMATIEVACYLVARHYRYEYFSYEREFFEGVEQSEFETFVASKYFDPQLAWNNPISPTRVFRKNCVGETIEYNYQEGSRVTPGVVKGQEAVAIFGESYSQGEEVADGSTISSILSRDHGIPTINYGVNAYDPLQAALKFKASLPEIPQVRTAVLLVMHENIWRVVNSFKPVYFPSKNEFYFGLKPYVKDGTIVPLAYPKGFPDFLREARTRFKEDYWTKPERRFPYSLSLIRALSSHSFVSRMWAQLKGPFVYEYQVNPETRAALATALQEFVSVADSAHIRPVIVFIPRFKRSYGVSRSFVESLNEKWGRELAHEFVDETIEWNRYKLSEDRDWCHPSPYGYGRIALFVSKILVPAAIGPAATYNRGGPMAITPRASEEHSHEP
jgi:hypothetical protein